VRSHARPLAAALLAAAATLVAIAPGCGYRTSFPLPEHIKTFSVNTFRNKTLERNLDFEFTEAFIHEVLARTRLRLARPGDADLVIDGEIESFDRHTLRRLRYGEKMAVRYMMAVNIEAFDTRKNVPFFQGRRIVERADFSLNLGETPRDGRDEVVRELARRVAALVFEPWPPEQPQEAEASAR